MTSHTHTNGSDKTISILFATFVHPVRDRTSYGYENRTHAEDQRHAIRVAVISTVTIVVWNRCTGLQFVVVPLDVRGIAYVASLLHTGNVDASTGARYEGSVPTHL